ncbi:CPC_1213 family protein [Clostridium sp. BJN0013]|uniref:CPC_1213 family protein n=1 Tax=Clostridium sp. BJN0013 TaxID=3236840 RepID=UPI0034C61459
MSKRNKKRSTRNEKTQDGKFHSKHIKHDPQAESARAVFDLDNDNTENKNESF